MVSNSKSRGKRRAPPQFEGELNEPILAPFDLPERNADGKLILGGSFFQIMIARMRKLDALRKHYEIESKDGNALALALACDFVPGFRVLYDDPRARALELPDAYYGSGTKPKGSGAIPEFLNGPILTFLFEQFAKRFPTRGRKTWRSASYFVSSRNSLGRVKRPNAREPARHSETASVRQGEIRPDSG